MKVAANRSVCHFHCQTSASDTIRALPLLLFGNGDVAMGALQGFALELSDGPPANALLAHHGYKHT